MQILNEFYYQNSTTSLFGSNITSPFQEHLKSQNITQYLQTVYKYQVDNVRTFVTNHPSHALVEVDITNNQTGKVLAETFGLHEDCWGHFNKKSPRKKNRV
jgi:hypothetical protein